MAWTTPRTWVAGAKLLASQLNEHVRDNLNYLKGLVDTSFFGAYHQGGSETQLNLPGTSNYAKSGLTMIHGVAYFAVGDNDVTVTYPFTWADKPFLIIGLPYQYGTGGFSGSPYARLGGDTAGQSATDFDIDLAVSDRTAVFAVPWIAIGTPA